MDAARVVQQQHSLLARCDSEPIHVPGAVQSHGCLIAFTPPDGRVVYRSENVASLLGLAVDPLGGTLGETLGEPASAQILTTAAPAHDLIPARFVLPSGKAVDITAYQSDGLTLVEFEVPESEERATLLHEARRAVAVVQSTGSVNEACAAAVDEVRRLTGYARVMAYRFHADEHGEVIAEARRDDLEAYLGLHYPASDIPRPARRLLRLSPVRLLVDVDATPVAIAGYAAFAERPLDLSLSTLRALSPVHLQYLRNMGVGASLTISLVDGPHLWGLLACHHDERKLPSPAVRSACAIVARTLWQKIEARERLDDHREQRHRLSIRAHFLATVSSVQPLAENFMEDGHSLLDLVACDGASVRIDGASARAGTTPSSEQIAALVEHFRESHATETVTTSESAIVAPGLGLDVSTAAGILAVPLSPDWQEYVMWFRGDVKRTLTWAGDPSKPTAPLPSGRVGELALSPRTSFAAWREAIHGRSADWSASDVSAVADFTASLPALRAVRDRDALAERALRDGLTGLPNRALLLDRIEVALAALRRHGGTITLLFLDLDGFKAVNDSLGHAAGDELLVEVAARLSLGMRSSDTVARLGGDEFVVLCTESSTATEIDRLVARLLGSLARPITVHAEERTVTASIGIATIDKARTAADALRAADAAMYRAKRLGRHRAAR